MSLLLATSGNIASGVVEAEGVDFDGVNDYLIRSTDLVGNVDSKTFTFSAWVYTKNNEATDYLFSNWDGGNGDFYVFITNTGAFSAIGRNTSNNIIFSVTSSILIPLNTWTNILISIDLSSTSLRHLYINDVLDTPTWNTYSNQLIDFTGSSFVVSATGSFASIFEGRLSNLFLDYTYRDLSIEANRRLFITADGKPTPTATLKALNPILYLPMKDAATAHINEGTGGNFTLNGTIATSNRGANQQNCTQLSLDGTADYLSRSGLSGTSSKELLISVNTKAKESATLSIISTRPITLQHIPASSKFSLKAYNSSNVLILSVDIPIYSTSLNIEYSLQCSVDLTNTSNRKVQLNGVDITASCTWITYTNDNIEYSYVGTISIGLATYYQEIGELYLGNSYLSNLSSFWDSVENKPVPVRKVIANTVVIPLIAMPLDASNAGKNYGTGGDFTANSAPYVGARGASEFWARSAKFDGSTGYLSKGTMGTTTKTISAFFFANSVNLTSRGIVTAANGVNDRFSVYIGSTSGTLTIVAKSLTNSNVIIATTSITFSANTWFSCFISIDLTSTATRQIAINGVVDTGVTWSVYNTAENIYLADATEWRVGEHARTDLNYFLEGNIGSSYLTSQYIDFSQEVNRLKFIDGLGYPLDLAKQIEAGVIPNPLIYLPFNDPSNLGLNLGTGGNFTVNGTVTQGADVNG